MAAGAPLLLQALAKGAQVLATARYRAAAHAFAAAKMADIELASREGALPSKTAGSFQQAGQRFEWGIRAEPTGHDPGLQAVTLTVEWRQGPHRYESAFTTIQRAPDPVEQSS